MNKDIGNTCLVAATSASEGAAVHGNRCKGLRTDAIKMKPLSAMTATLHTRLKPHAGALARGCQCETGCESKLCLFTHMQAQLRLAGRELLTAREEASRLSCLGDSLCYLCDRICQSLCYLWDSICQSLCYLCDSSCQSPVHVDTPYTRLPAPMSADTITLFTYALPPACHPPPTHPSFTYPLSHTQS